MLCSPHELKDYNIRSGSLILQYTVLMTDAYQARFPESRYEHNFHIRGTDFIWSCMEGSFISNHVLLSDGFVATEAAFYLLTNLWLMLTSWKENHPARRTELDICSG